MARNVIRTETFIRRLSKLDKSFIERIEKLVIKILENPEIGKPMMYKRKGTRELYSNPFRLSYAYNKSSDTICFLDVYHKDEQ